MQSHGERQDSCPPLLERTTQLGAFDQGGITLPKTSAVSLERRSLGSAVEMEDLVHDLPIAIQLQQREHVCEARPRPVVDFQAHVRDRANDVDF